VTRLEALDALPAEALVPVGFVREALAEARAATGDGLVDLTVEDVAGVLGRAPSTIRTWLGAGQLEGYKLRGREWRVPREALEKLRDETRAGAVGPSPGFRDRPAERERDRLGDWRDEIGADDAAD